MGPNRTALGAVWQVDAFPIGSIKEEQTLVVGDGNLLLVVDAQVRVMNASTRRFGKELLPEDLVDWCLRVHCTCECAQRQDEQVISEFCEVCVN